MMAVNSKNEDKGILPIIIAYVLLTCVVMWLHVRVIEAPQEGMRRELHAQVLQNKAPAPSQYRFVVFYAAEGLQRAGVPFAWSYTLIRGLFTFLAALALHLFLIRWFRQRAAFAGVVFLFLVLPFTYYKYFMQPQDMVNLFLFVCGLSLIRDRRDFLLAPLLFVGMLNRETMIVLVFVYLFYRYDELPLESLLLRGGAYSIICAGTYAGLRAYFGHHNYEFTDFIFIEENFTRVVAYISTGFVMLLFAAAARGGLARRPKFAARAAGLIPFFLIIHWTCTRMWEPRLLLPLMPVIIPLALFKIFDNKPNMLRAPDAPRMDATPDPPIADHFATRRPAAALAILSAGFAVVFTFFCWYNVQSHLGERRARELINKASVAQREGRVDEARELLRDAVELAPDFAQAHMSLGIIYLNEGKPELAARHLRIALNLEPDSPYADRIRKQLAALEKRR